MVEPVRSRLPVPPLQVPLLQVRGLRIAAFGAGGAHSLLVDDVSFDVPAGQVLGLIGESGAGKSTIGLAALGYLRPGCRIVGGTVQLDGATVATNPRLRGEAITYVPQSAAASFNPAFRIVRQVCETALRRGLLDRAGAARTASALFRRLGLTAPDFGARFPHQVSGGQLQRAATAMALCTSPRIVVFDEPTTALDVTVQVEVMRLIRESIREAGLAALYISHDLAVVAQMADRIMVLRGGKMVEQGTAQAVISAPAAEYTGRLVSVRLAVKLPITQTGRDVLAVDDVFAGYGAVDVVRGVSLRLTAGHTLAVVGESGSGKSSLARVLTGLLPPRQGTLSLGGRRLSARLRDRSRDDRRAVQLIHQNPDIALNPRQTVETILGRPLTVFGKLSGAALRARIAELLGQMELGPAFLQRRPGELSGGQKQRICIARALAAAPEVVICDEVTSALDPLVADGIVKLLMRIQRESGVAFIVITHDIALVRAVADEVLVMQGGLAVERGPSATILDTPTQDYTRTLIQSVPEMDVDWLTRLAAARDAARAASPQGGISQ